MKRKDYERPTTKVVQLQHHGMLMTSVYETTGSGKTSLTEMEAEENL